MSCKYCENDMIYHIQEDWDELEHRSSKPKKGSFCTIPEKRSVLKADEISSYCNDDKGYLQCNKKKSLINSSFPLYPLF